MKIERLHIAHFGKFSDYTLAFEDGFSVFYGDNEDGKSTILECLRMLFYGSAGRGSDPGKNPRIKYLPWDGSKMAAAVEFQEKGRHYRLERNFGKTNSGDRVVLKDALTGEILPCSGEPGEEFFGMGLSAFEKSLFIGQLGGFSGSADKEDEMNRRLANLVSTGDETASYTLVEQRLKKAQNSLCTPKKVGALDKQEQKLENLREELQNARQLEEQEASLKFRQKEREETQKLLEEKEKAAEGALKIQEALEELQNSRRELQQSLRLEELEKEEKKCRGQLLGADGKKADAVLLQEAEKHWKDLDIQKVLYSDASQRLATSQKEWEAFLEETDGEENAAVPSREKMEVFFSLKKTVEENKKKEETYQKSIRLQKQMRQVKDAAEALEKSRRRVEELLPQVRQKEEEWERLKEEKEKAEAALAEAELSHRQLLWKKEQEEKQRRETEISARREENARKGRGILLLVVGGILLAAGIFLGIYVHPAAYLLSVLGAGAGILGAFSLRKPAVSEEMSSEIPLQEEEERLRLEEEKQRLSSILPLLEEAEKQLLGIREEERKAREDSKRDEGIYAYCEKFLKNSLSSYTKEEIRAAAEIVGKEEVSASGETSEIPALEAEKKLEEILKTYGCEKTEELEKRFREKQERVLKKEQLQQECAKASEEAEKKKKDVLSVIQELRSCLGAFSEKGLHNMEEIRETFLRLKEGWEQLRQISQKKAGLLQGLEKAPEPSFVLEERIQKEEKALMEESGELPEPLSPEELAQLESSLRQIRKERGELQRQEGAEGQQAEDLWKGRLSVSQLERLIAEEEQSAGEKRERLEALKIAGDAMEHAFRELQSGYGPLLNTAAAEIFRRLTGGKYTGMLVDKSFGLSVMEKGESSSHEWKYLSSGTVDQAYFALRLAISHLICGGEKELPLFLDDVFAQYDDTRTEQGLRFLQEYAGENGGQIFLFTCHRHLASMAQKKGAGLHALQSHIEKEK